jgi:hypothetical protein
MAQRVIETDIHSIVALMTHYLDGKSIPLDVEVESLSVSPLLQRWLLIWCRSGKWMDGQIMPDGGVTPLHVRFEGGKVMTIKGKGEEPTWAPVNEDPKRQ